MPYVSAPILTSRPTDKKIFIASLFLPYTVRKRDEQNSNQSEKEVKEKKEEDAYEFIPSNQGNIGLHNAVNSSTLLDHEKVWVGLLSNFSTDHETTPAKTLNWIHKRMRAERSCLPVFVTDEEFCGHYQQFCKQILWRPFHYQLSDYPKGLAYEDKAWIQYVAVNQKFANTIAETYQSGDIVWVNDYHLMLVPLLLRELIPDAIIGFFLHIPFPSSEIFRCIHVRKEILGGLLGSDLVGFQTYSFMRHFLMTSTRILSLETTQNGVKLDNTTVSTGIFPIGINADVLKEKKSNLKVPEMVASLLEKYAGKKIIFGRDKNDYVKGVRQKMMAFEMFLCKYPEWIGRVVMIQVALSTTEANQNEAHVNDVVVRINAKYGSIEYTPVVYIHQDIDFLHYLALLTVADACLITSLRDGMNLTSHEYVVCQEGKHSPLIISEFAGTYGSFGAALRVNPWDRGEVADIIHEALTMSQEEKLYRWTELNAHVLQNTAQRFVDGYLEELVRVHGELQKSLCSSIPLLSFSTISGAYNGCQGRRIFFLDYDGTLKKVQPRLRNVPMKLSISNTGLESATGSGKFLGIGRSSKPANMTPNNPKLQHCIPMSRSASAGLIFPLTSSSKFVSRETKEEVIVLLTRLVADRRNLVYVVSEKMKDDMEELMGIRNLGLSAENGGFIKFTDSTSWESLSDSDLSWQKNVEEIFQYYQDRTPGSYIEHKELSLVWHYGLADLSFGAWQAAECINHIDQSLSNTYPIHVLAKKTCVEVSPLHVNKGLVVKRALEHHKWHGVRNHQRGSNHSMPKHSPSNSSPSSQSFSTTTLPPSVIPAPLFPSMDEPIDFIFACGGDRADEYMFEYLNKLEVRLLQQQTSVAPFNNNTASSAHPPTYSTSTDTYCVSVPKSLTFAQSSGVGHTSFFDSIMHKRHKDNNTSGGASSGSHVHTPNTLSRHDADDERTGIPIPRLRSNVSSAKTSVHTGGSGWSPSSSPGVSPISPGIGNENGTGRYILTCTVNRGKSSAAKWSLPGSESVGEMLNDLL